MSALIKAQVNRKIHNHLKPKEREREKERKERERERDKKEKEKEEIEERQRKIEKEGIEGGRKYCDRTHSHKHTIV